MSTQNAVSCPADFVQMNENKARLIASQVFLITLFIALFSSWMVSALLAIDFLLRAFNLNRYSILAKSADLLITLFGIGSKPVDQAPKRFAARIGLTLSVGITVLYIINYPIIATSLSGVLIFFSFLESVFAFCAGCHLYTLIQRFSSPASGAKA